LIFEIGTAYTKVGFAGEANPRQIIPTETTVDGVSQSLALVLLVVKFDRVPFSVSFSNVEDGRFRIMAAASCARIARLVGLLALDW
jgi:hypothetical protein